MKHLLRGLLGGVCWGAFGIGSTILAIAFVRYEHFSLWPLPSLDWQSNARWWSECVFPAMVVSTLCFFAGAVSHVTAPPSSFARNLALMAFMSLPPSALLGALGMAQREKSVSHPPVAASEFAMFVLPQFAVSLFLMRVRRCGDEFAIDDVASGRSIHSTSLGRRLD